jgi:hypothetical protein
MRFIIDKVKIQIKSCVGLERNDLSKRQFLFLNRCLEVERFQDKYSGQTVRTTIIFL